MINVLGLWLEAGQLYSFNFSMIMFSSDVIDDPSIAAAALKKFR